MAMPIPLPYGPYGSLMPSVNDADERSRQNTNTARPKYWHPNASNGGGSEVQQTTNNRAGYTASSGGEMQQTGQPGYWSNSSSTQIMNNAAPGGMYNSNNNNNSMSNMPIMTNMAATGMGMNMNIGMMMGGPMPGWGGMPMPINMSGWNNDMSSLAAGMTPYVPATGFGWNTALHQPSTKPAPKPPNNRASRSSTPTTKSLPRGKKRPHDSLDSSSPAPPPTEMMKHNPTIDPNTQYDWTPIIDPQTQTLLGYQPSLPVLPSASHSLLPPPSQSSSSSLGGDSTKLALQRRLKLRILQKDLIASGKDPKTAAVEAEVILNRSSSFAPPPLHGSTMPYPIPVAMVPIPMVGQQQQEVKKEVVGSPDKKAR
ncbi:hypothetical protein HK097_004999, partial [Rhizophlyctis rosea]